MSALEIAVQDVHGAIVASENGADRVELCSALAMGGLTPSNGLAEAVMAKTGEKPDFVHALIRSRGGGFVYSQQEIDTMCREIQQLAQLGCHGFVVGALKENKEIDHHAVELFSQAAGNLPLTFHRAFDVVPDQFIAMEQLQSLGVKRILTSGGEPAAGAGLGRLSELVAAASSIALPEKSESGQGRTQERIQIMAGGGVRVADIWALCQAGVDAVHLSARTISVDPHPCGPGGGAGEIEITDAEIVSAARFESLRES